jgi:hypothetical protein
MEVHLKMSEFLTIIPKASPVLLLFLFVGLIVSAISGVLILRESSTKVKLDDTNDRLKILEQKVENQSKKIDKLLEKIETISNGASTGKPSGLRSTTNTTINIDIPLPPPASEKNVGYETAIYDTLKDALPDNSKKIYASRVFKAITESDSLVNLVLSNRLKVNAIVMKGRSANVKSSTVSEHEVALEVENFSNDIIETLIPKGQVFENKKSGSAFQNLVNAENYRVTLNPRQKIQVYLPGHCLNRDLKSPTGQKGNITPIAVNFEFTNQNSVWAQVKKRVENVQ